MGNRQVVSEFIKRDNKMRVEILEPTLEVTDKEGNVVSRRKAKSVTFCQQPSPECVKMLEKAGIKVIIKKAEEDNNG